MFMIIKEHNKFVQNIYSFKDIIMLQVIKYLCVITTFLTFNSTIIEQEKTHLAKKKVNTIEGEWEGNLLVSKGKTVGINWRFEKTKQGKLIGFMGPASKGVATIPMQEIVLSGNTLKFKIHSEGSFTGKIISKEIKGFWLSKSGKKLPLNMARELTKKQLSKRFSNSNNKNDIHQSIKLGNIDAIKTYLKKGNDINKVDKKGLTLLISSIKYDRSNKIISFLLNNGANPNIKVGGITPLMYSLAYQNINAAKLLVNKNAEINYVNKDGQSAIVFAIKGRNKEALQLLLDNGADKNLKIKENYTAIDLAKEENSREILEVLKIPYYGISDGPYISNSDKGHNAIWVHKSNVHNQTIKSSDSRVIDYKGAKATLWKNTPKEVEKLVYNGDFKIGAISDIHGQYDTFIELLINNNVINKQGNWSFGNGHFVIAGDIFDRGPNVTEVLWFLYNLEKQAERKGGKLHVLLGNHDVMVLNGNLRSVHPKYNEVAKILDKPLQTLFNKGTVLGDWLRTRPVVVKINQILFTHGGLHPDLVTKNLSITQINSVFKDQLIESELVEKRSELGSYLHRGNGPIYYRGYFQGKKATDVEIDQLLSHFKITTIVVGHTTHRQIETRYNGKVIVIDANMKSGGAGEMLLWKSGKFTRGTLDGKQLSLEIKQ